MKTMIFNEFGGLDVFEAAELIKPDVKAGHVLVKIEASRMSMADILISKMGGSLSLAPEMPALSGTGFAGTVEAVGDGVTDFMVDDQVYGCAGGLTDMPGPETAVQFIVADEKLIARKPRNLTVCEAAALPLAGIMAYEGLIRAGISSRQRVLVHGASRSVGYMAVQLAQYFGAEVYATGDGDGEMARIEPLGAITINTATENVADYVAKYTDNAGFELVFDAVGGGNMPDALQAAALKGSVISTAPPPQIESVLAQAKGLALHMMFILAPVLHNFNRREYAHILARMTTIAESGVLRPMPDG